MIRIPTNGEPTHLGDMLREEFLIPLNMTQWELAKAIHVSYQGVNEIVRRKRGVTPSTALLFEKFFGTSAGFWMNIQLRWDLDYAQRSEEEVLQAFQPYIVKTTS